jgi:hypothetical protein
MSDADWELNDMLDDESLNDDDDLKLMRETFRVRLMGYVAVLIGAMLMVWATAIFVLGFLG